MELYPADIVATLEATCDGMFLLMDTARHNGFQRQPSEILGHIRDCADCRVRLITY